VSLFRTRGAVSIAFAVLKLAIVIQTARIRAM
jgi:hypothetical protein